MVRSLMLHANFWSSFKCFHIAAAWTHKGQTHKHPHKQLKAPSYVISGATHPENIKGIVPWGPETAALHCHERGFPKQNPFLIALLWALWGFTWNESNLLPWCSYFVLDSMRWGGLTHQTGSSTTMWIKGVSTAHCTAGKMKGSIYKTLAPCHEV